MEDNLIILIVDDHPIFRDGIADVIHSIYLEATILKASTGDEALSLASQYEGIDWIFLDLKLPDYNALELIPKLDKFNLFASIVIVSSEDQLSIIDNILNSNANGFLSKTADKGEFQKCIQHIEQGKQYVQEYLREPLQHYRSSVLNELRHIQNNLSSRHHEVLVLLNNGLSNMQISQALNISESTVKAHVSHLMTTLQANSRTHCAFKARQLGIIT